MCAFNLSPINTNSIAFDRGHSTLRAHFSLGIGKFDTLPNPLLTLANADTQSKPLMACFVENGNISLR